MKYLIVANPVKNETDHDQIHRIVHDNFKEALENGLTEIIGKAQSVKLPDGKPYLFPDGINSIHLEVSIGETNSVTINLDGVAGAPLKSSSNGTQS